MDTPLKKRLKGLSWHTLGMALPFIAGFLADKDVRALIEMYPKQLGFLLTIGLITAQITRAINGYYQFKKEMEKFQ